MTENGGLLQLAGIKIKKGDLYPLPRSGLLEQMHEDGRAILYLAVCRTIVILNYNGFNTVMGFYSPGTYARVLQAD